MEGSPALLEAPPSDAPEEALLSAVGVTKRYGAVVALRNASLSVRPGEVHALMGANGAGKSTLVKILTGAVHPDSGTIRLRGWLLRRLLSRPRQRPRPERSHPSRA